MRRTFKEHIVGHCLYRQIKYIERKDPWELEINDGEIRITKNKNGEYEFFDREGNKMIFRASDWDLACNFIESCINHEEEESIY